MRCLLGALLLVLPGLAGAAPARVVSMNLCTDQLAMLLAAPGQLVSVSYLAADPRASAMAAEAAAYPANRGLAEEVFLLRPDLVLAGSFTTKATVEMLERLGVPVLVAPPAYSLADVRSEITRIGAALGREEAARALLARFDEGLAATPAPVEPRPSAMVVGGNGYASGPASLVGEVVAAAGFANGAASLGLESGGRVSLEELVMHAPDLLVLPEPYPGASRAEEIPRHPALAGTGTARVTLPDRNWVCGTPALLENLAALAAERERIAP